jgi:hypothetical protein
MVFLYTVLIILICILVFLSANRVWFIIDFSPRLKLPGKGRGTMFDVRHLLMEGEKEAAIQLYCEIFHTMPAQARKDVEELERSLKV